MLYSAMSHKPLARVGADDMVQVRAIPPFWAVMLAGRDTAHMVNMLPYMEEYTVPHPVAKTHGGLANGAKLTLKLPFLSNRNDLSPGDLLVMPFDGGMSEICCVEFPPLRPVNTQGL